LDRCDLDSSNVNLNLVRLAFGAANAPFDRKISARRTDAACFGYELRSLRPGAVRFASPRVDQRHIALNACGASRIWNGTLCLWTAAPSRHQGGMLDSVMLRFVPRRRRHVCTPHRFNCAGRLVSSCGMQGRLGILGSRRVRHSIDGLTYRV
jgi:hypothetical protein